MEQLKQQNDIKSTLKISCKMLEESGEDKAYIKGLYNTIEKDINQAAEIIFKKMMILMEERSLDPTISEFVKIGNDIYKVICNSDIHLTTGFIKYIVEHGISGDINTLIKSTNFNYTCREERYSKVMSTLSTMRSKYRSLENKFTPLLVACIRTPLIIDTIKNNLKETQSS